MPRKARILVPNCPHHLVQRGHNRKAVFLEARDYRYYLDNLKEWKQKLEIKIYAWCLMTNHIHLIAEPGSDAMTIAQLMKRVNGRQSRIKGDASIFEDKGDASFFAAQLNREIAILILGDSKIKGDPSIFIELKGTHLFLQHN